MKVNNLRIDVRTHACLGYRVAPAPGFSESKLWENSIEVN
jgi:hypothetical protein